MTRRCTPVPDDEQGAHAKMMERLKTLTGDRKPLERVDPALPNDPVKPITQTVTLPNGYVAEPPTLEWLTPINHPNGEKTQISAGGQYEVCGRRCPEGFTFIARHGLNVLGTARTAQDARTKCLLHLVEACGG